MQISINEDIHQQLGGIHYLYTETYKIAFDIKNSTAFEALPQAFLSRKLITSGKMQWYCHYKAFKKGKSRGYTTCTMRHRLNRYLMVEWKVVR